VRWLATSMSTLAGLAADADELVRANSELTVVSRGVRGNRISLRASQEFINRGPATP
jgi:hypothetical protein